MPMCTTATHASPPATGARSCISHGQGGASSDAAMHRDDTPVHHGAVQGGATSDAQESVHDTGWRPGVLDWRTNEV
jgi:hypothetical protein